MNLRRHRIPRELFAALAAGGGGATAIRYLAAAQRSKHVLLIRGVVDWATATGHERAPQARQAYDLLADIQNRAPEVVDAVLRHPSVGAWAQRTLRALDHDGARASAEPGRLAALAAAAAVRAGARCAVEVPVIDGMVMLPSLGAVAAPRRHGDAVVRSGADGAEVITEGRCTMLPADPHVDAPGWQALRGLSAVADGKAISLLIDDLDPYRMPATADLAGRLTAAGVGAWRSALHTAWTLLTRHHWTSTGEISGLISVLTPLVSSGHGQVSASSRETFGCVALSTPPDGRTLAVTLAHEVQHAKLSALLDIVSLTRLDDGTRYYAPWRDDPRPINGLLQGAYAYLGVSGFWRRQRHHEHVDDAVDAHAEFARWREASWQVVQTLLLSGRLTEAGETFVAGMARTLRAWQDERVPAASLTAARQAADHHQALWRLHHGDIKPHCGSGRP
jgi:HEXXH motif-containing protein